MPNASFIHIDGNPMDDSLLAEITVAQELNSHSWCSIDLRQTSDQRFPAEDMLGKGLQIVTTGEDGSQNVVFDGMVVESELEYEVYGSFSAHLSAVMRSYLLDLTPRRRYFRQLTAKQVVTQIISDAGLVLEGNMPEGPTADYLQCEETDWAFILRLIDDVEAWARPTAKGVEVQTSFQTASDLPWRQEHGLISFYVTGRLSQPASDGAHYDSATMESHTYSNVTDAPGFYGSVGQMVDAVKQKSKELLPAGYIGQRSRAATLSDYQTRLKRESKRSIGRSISCHGESGALQLKAGNQVNVQGPLDAQGSYGVTRVVHTWTGTGYTNHFDCTPWQQYTMPEQPLFKTVPGLAPARVVDNNDPANRGRVRLQLYWQETNETDWVEMMSPHAGADRGFMFLPEIGDEVWVAFEEGDPERPVVLGAAWNGVQKPPREEFWGKDVAPNDVKRIVTKSGHRITIVDKEGKSSIVLATPNHVRVSLIENSNETGDSMLALHSDGDIFLSAPNGRIHCHSKFFSREVG